MPLYTYEQAKNHLDAWLAADLAISTGQSYTIANRTLTRANIKDVHAMIKYWQAHLKAAIRAENGQRAPSRIRRYVPVDE
ncbi:hypothetical protein SAMN05216312_102226 [Cohnella sp. OV330]|uniref:DUF6148 family protein n=1 Tax=Cohnella sp. OV330 TaxID=1855288 RepID=UPI0008F3B962|nr:DUF6148 family protein [Cohnella sp. OV330]SFA91724.1 hypothetical protein SAMN05216312_102226 [Cohnella sp. OV330]